MKTVPANPNSHASFRKNVPDAFKTYFDTAKSKISQNAGIPAKNYGFTKQKHIRGGKTLKI